MCSSDLESANYNSMNAGMNPMQPQMMPGGVNSNFYAGPPLNPNQGPNMNQVPMDIDSRLSKIERQLNRLETRISKLEGDTGINAYPEHDYNYSNNMYMV